MIGNVNSQSKVVLGQTCMMEGKLTAQNAEISGQLNGTIQVSDKLILKATAVVNADVVYGKIEIEDGAVLNGTLKIGGGVVKNINEKGQNTKKEKSA